MPGRTTSEILGFVFLLSSLGPLCGSARGDVAPACQPTVIARTDEHVSAAVSRGKDVVVLRHGGITILDGDNLTTRGELLLHAPAGLAVDGDLAFVASKTRGIEIVDLSDPALPRLAGEFFEPGGYKSILVSSPWGWALSSNGRLDLFDLADPLRPSRVRAGLASDTDAIQLQRNRLFRRQGNDIFIEEVRRPLDGLQALGRVSSGSSFLASGSILFTSSVGCGSNYAAIWEISDSTPPRLLDIFHRDGSYSFGAADGEILALSSGYRSMLWRIGDPSAPIGLGEFPGGNALAFHRGDLLVDLDVWVTTGGLALLELGSCRATGDAPVADFDFAPSVAAEGEPVSFVDRTRGTPESWRWDFGDGNGSSEPNPRHAFRSAGPKRVELEVWSRVGRSRTSRVVDVRKNPERSPIDFDWQPRSPKTGEAVRLTARASAPVDSWRWRLDDGRELEGESIEIAWAGTGGKTIRLSAQIGGEPTSIEKTITVAGVDDCRPGPNRFLRLSPNISRAVVSPDGFVFAFGDGRIRVFDARGPGLPELLPGSTLSVPIRPPDALLDWDRRLLLVVSGDISLYDVSNPSAISRLGSFLPRSPAPYDSAIGVALRGDRLYVTDKEGKIEVANISDPRNPVRVAEWECWWRGYASFVVEGRWLYALASGSRWLDVLDLDSGEGPFPVSRLTLPGAASSRLVVDRGRAMIGVGEKIVFVDLSDPFAPRVVREVGAGNRIEKLRLHDGLLWFLDSSPLDEDRYRLRLAAIDPRDTAAVPSSVVDETWGSVGDFFPTPAGVLLSRADGIWLLDSAACQAVPAPFAADFGWSPAQPIAEETVVLTDRSTGSEGPARWRIDGGEPIEGAIVEHRFDSVGSHTVLLEIDGPEGPGSLTKSIDVLPRPDPPTAAFTWPAWPRAGSPVRFVDESTPPEGLSRAWQEEGRTPLFEESPEILFPLMGIYGMTIHVRNAAGQDSVSERVKIHHPTADCEPPVVGALDPEKYPLRLHRDDFGVVVAYETDRSWGLVAYDVSDPEKPFSKGEYIRDGFYSERFDDVAIANGVAAVDVRTGISIVDLAGPQDWVATIPGQVDDIEMSGNLLAALRCGEVRLYSVEDPAHPTLTTTIDTDGCFRSLAFDEDLLIVNGYSELLLWEITPSGPELRGSLDLLWWANRSVALSGGLLAVAGFSEITLFDLSVRTNPRELARTDLGYAPSEYGRRWSSLPRLRFDGDVLEVVIEEAGLHRVDVSDPENPIVFSASPRREAYDAVEVGSQLWLLSDKGLERLDGSACPAPGRVERNAEEVGLARDDE